MWRASGISKYLLAAEVVVGGDAYGRFEVVASSSTAEPSCGSGGVGSSDASRVAVSVRRSPRDCATRAHAASGCFISSVDSESLSIRRFTVKDEPRFAASIFRALRPRGRFVFATTGALGDRDEVLGSFDPSPPANEGRNREVRTQITDARDLVRPAADVAQGVAAPRRGLDFDWRTAGCVGDLHGDAAFRSFDL